MCRFWSPNGRTAPTEAVDSSTENLYHNHVAIHISHTKTRAKCAELLDRGIDGAEIAIFTRRKHPAVAMINAAELERMQTALNTLSSPENVRRFNQGIAKASVAKSSPKV
jgi:PHD/YefM family antitoxin component YafN of YafNO toxin-antitoxin module